MARRDWPLQPLVDDDERRRPNLQRSLSRTQTIKNYIRKSTVTFFGVDDENEDDQRRRWMERRQRMASKCYGQVKPDYQRQTSREDAVSLGRGSVPLDTPDSGPPPPPSAVSRSWPRQMSRISDITTEGSTAGIPLRSRPSRRQKDSVARLTWDGLTYIASTVVRRRSRTAAGVLPTRPQTTHTLSFPLMSVTDDSVFEDSADPFAHVVPQVELLPSPDEDSVTDDVFYDRITTPSPVSTPRLPGEYLPPPLMQPPPAPSPTQPPELRDIPPRWRRSVPEPREVPDQEELSVGMRRMWKRITDQLFDNSNRRQYGMGVVGRYLRRSFRKDRITSEVKEQLDDIDDHRPYFTYWVTTVQLLITIISLAVYGFGPIGFEQTQRSGLVLVTSLYLQQVDYYEPDNFWIGPRAADLVHLGAKFAPCMRRDQNVFRAIESDRASERNTACCIRNDNSGCVQTSRDECFATISTWKKWSFENTGPGGRISGSVCGQDPSYCSDPPSAPPYSWPDDITKWPICRRKVRSELSSHEHMACEVIGHPCCIGILGECQITTRDYCEFVKGFFHEEAALCSQVSCLDDICGMIPFYNPDVPDQFYRLWTSLFLHAGLVHLSVTVLVQYFLMRDLEKLTGALRIGLIYIVSGVAGNLASAIFVPYRAEVGPAGSQFGLLACLIVEVIHCWQMLKNPGIALLKLLVMVFILFILGLLPWIDNYAHLFGFVFGFLLSYALLPFVSFGVYDRRKKITLIWICLLLVIGLFAVLLLLFYIYPIYDCEICKYLTCLPLTQNFCTTQGINITSRRQQL